MMPSDDTQYCDEMQDELAELALGILGGRRRSEVLRHVDRAASAAARSSSSSPWWQTRGVATLAGSLTAAGL